MSTWYATGETLPAFRYRWIDKASPLQLKLAATFVALLAFALNQGLHWLFYPSGDIQLLGARVFADILPMACIGYLLYRVMVLVQVRRAAVAQRVNQLVDVHHHIRNALEIIRLSAHSMRDEQAIAMIEDGVERIQWVLRELLQG
jgi:hypothetical protein